MEQRKPDENRIQELEKRNETLEAIIVQQQHEIEALKARELDLINKLATDPISQLTTQTTFVNVSFPLLLEARRRSAMESTSRGEVIEINGAMIDFNYFKELFNGAFNYDAGNFALRLAGIALKRAFHRASDTVLRHGGDEIVAVVQGEITKEKFEERCNLASDTFIKLLTLFGLTRFNAISFYQHGFSIGFGTYKESVSARNRHVDLESADDIYKKVVSNAQTKQESEKSRTKDPNTELYGNLIMNQLRSIFDSMVSSGNLPEEVVSYFKTGRDISKKQLERNIALIEYFYLEEKHQSPTHIDPAKAQKFIDRFSEVQDIDRVEESAEGVQTVRAYMLQEYLRKTASKLSVPKAYPTIFKQVIGPDGKPQKDSNGDVIAEVELDPRIKAKFIEIYELLIRKGISEDTRLILEQNNLVFNSNDNVFDIIRRNMPSCLIG